MNRKLVLLVFISAMLLVAGSLVAGNDLHQGGPLDLTITGAYSAHVKEDVGDISGGAFFVKNAVGSASCQISLNGETTDKKASAVMLSMMVGDRPCPGVGSYPILSIMKPKQGEFTGSVMANDASYLPSKVTLTVTKATKTEIDGKIDGEFKEMVGPKTIHVKGTFKAVPGK